MIIWADPGYCGARSGAVHDDECSAPDHPAACQLGEAVRGTNSKPPGWTILVGKQEAVLQQESTLHRKLTAPKHIECNLGHARNKLSLHCLSEQNFVCSVCSEPISHLYNAGNAI